jgi:hypothetical protein
LVNKYGDRQKGEKETMPLTQNLEDEAGEGCMSSQVHSSVMSDSNNEDAISSVDRDEVGSDRSLSDVPMNEKFSEGYLSVGDLRPVSYNLFTTSSVPKVPSKPLKANNLKNILKSNRFPNEIIDVEEDNTIRKEVMISHKESSYKLPIRDPRNRVINAMQNLNRKRSKKFKEKQKNLSKFVHRSPTLIIYYY